jgi:acyl-CoA thioester hydrolase
MIKPARIHVRFSDLDLLGHVNNTIYLSYFEIARVHYFGKLIGKDWNWKKYGVVLVKNEVEYLKPVLLNDKPYIEIKTTHLGNKSFTLSYELTVDGVIYTKGSSTLVCFDSTRNETISIPEVMREGLLRLKEI